MLWLVSAYSVIFFKNIKMQYLMVSKRKNTKLCEDGIKNSVSHDHRLLSLSKPCDANL